MSQILLIIGAGIFGLLGSLHLIYTFFTPKFDSHDPAIKAAMKDGSPRITRETTMWKAWIGFNASHSLGAMLFAGIYIPLALNHMEVIIGSSWFTLLPLLIGLSYLWLAQRYWFKIPLIGILIATLCFAGAAVMIFQ
ncbi:LIC_13387 family protein [Paremcibacter congregatus]|uniref:LIC_13387 family protein n=1 Tax=Paremcibacter congregatus TaxID=2043170 RepID=UPI0030EDC6EB|tara:strand:+ start:1712 stop:2122 length:411 start_codon:yes stop_codon:yes gene_type:complete